MSILQKERNEEKTIFRDSLKYGYFLKMNRIRLKKLVIVGIMVFLYACHSNISEKRIIITAFPIKEEMKTSVIQTPPVLLAPDEVFIMNNQLWVFQSKKDTLFDVFSLPDCNYLYATGKKGQGPNDFIFPIGKTIQAEENSFTLIDVFSMKKVIVQSDSILHTFKSEKIFEQIPINGFIKLNDSLFCAFADCATGTASNYEYQLMNLTDRKLVKFGEYPRLSEKQFEGDERCQIYYKYLVANPSKSKFAAFYSFFKFFRIYSYAGDLEQGVHVNIPPYQSDNLENREERKVYYGRPVATDNYIYAPCSANEIQVWDWDGHPIIQYVLDKTFFAFAVSEKYKKVYLVSAEETDLDKVYVFDLVHLVP
jgi:hypothetical protein